MKSIQHKSEDDFDSRNYKVTSRARRAARKKLSTGSINGRYPVVLNDGRTVIYITDKSKESEIRARYAV